MKLHYRILWIDDQVDEFISIGLKDDFLSFLEDLGFDANIDYFEDARLVLEELSKHKYDLILSDYNIDDEEGSEFNGDSLIKKIREGEIFTEVLFYSAQANFDDIAKNLYQDRVSFFNMSGTDSLREFKRKVINLISLTVDKLQEINSMRGLVMAQTSELDSAVENIILKYFDDNAKPDNVEKLKTYIHKIIKDSLNSNLKSLDKLFNGNYESIVKSRLFDADKKARTINKIIELEDVQSSDFADFHTTYKSDVLETRNNLAHARSENIDGTDYLIISGKDGEHSTRIGSEECKSIRRNLRRYTQLLRSIKEHVCA